MMMFNVQTSPVQTAHDDVVCVRAIDPFTYTVLLYLLPSQKSERDSNKYAPRRSPTYSIHTRYAQNGQ